MSSDVLSIAEEFNLAIKTDDHEQGETLKLELEAVSEDSLFAQLNTENKKKAFWLNIYNAYIQYFLKQNAQLYQKRGAFFRKKRIIIAGRKLSLDDVEHGIIRRSKVKMTLGYTQKWFPGRFEKRFRLDTLDFRIHFALNCGAKSCPPIAFYNWKQMNDQLELATKNYLKGECTYNETENKVIVPKLFSWFRGDFGGKKGTIKILKTYDVLPAKSQPKIEFKPYNWALELENYSE